MQRGRFGEDAVRVGINHKTCLYSLRTNSLRPAAHRHLVGKCLDLGTSSQVLS